MSDKNFEPSVADYDRAHLLVGRFMWHWSFVEFVLNESLRSLMEIEGTLQAAIITANMGVRDKLNAIRSLLLTFLGQNSPAGKEAAKILERIGDRNSDRNIVAHTIYLPHPKGLTFQTVKAKGEVSFPDLVWTVNDFKDREEKMNAVSEELRTIVAKALESERFLRVARRQSLQPTMSYSNALGSLGLLNFPPQPDPDSPQTSDETSSQSDPADRG